MEDFDEDMEDDLGDDDNILSFDDDEFDEDDLVEEHPFEADTPPQAVCEMANGAFNL